MNKIELIYHIIDYVCELTRQLCLVNRFISCFVITFSPLLSFQLFIRWHASLMADNVL